MVIKMAINFNNFDLTDETIKELNNLTQTLAKEFDESIKRQSSKEQNEIREDLASIAEIGKVLYDECLKQGFSQNEAIKFSASYIGNLGK